MNRRSILKILGLAPAMPAAAATTLQDRRIADPSRVIPGGVIRAESLRVGGLDEPFGGPDPDRTRIDWLRRRLAGDETPAERRRREANRRVREGYSRVDAGVNCLRSISEIHRSGMRARRGADVDERSSLQHLSHELDDLLERIGEVLT